MPVVELSISGNDNQETRSGSNMLNFDLMQSTRVAVNADGTLTINGAGGFGLNIKKVTLQPGVSYYQKYELVSGSITGVNSPFLSFTANLWIKNNDFVKTEVAETKEVSNIWVHDSAVFENAVIKLWANTDQSDFEAYGAMPSPEFPSEVETVNTQANIIICNKNELNFEEKTTSWAGSTVTVAGNKIKITGSETGGSSTSFSSNRQKVDLRKGTTITYSSKYVNGVLTEGNTYYHLYGINNKNEAKKIINMQRDGVANYKTDKQVTYTLEEDIKEIYISGSTYNVKGLTEELAYEFQLEIGDTATEIIEHTEQTKVVDIQQPMFTGDYFIKEEDGWKEVHGWKYGTFNANNYGVNNDGTKRLKITCWGFQNKANCEVLCKYIKNRNARWDDSNEIDNAIYGWDEYGSIGINVSKEIFSTSADFRIWALENNLGFYYQLATPLKLTCTETQSKQLDDLLNTSTYKNVTHIYSTDKVSPVKKIVYKKDLDTILNNQHSEYETRLSNIEKLLSTTTTSAMLLDNLQSDLEKEVL